MFKKFVPKWLAAPTPAGASTAKGRATTRTARRRGGGAGGSSGEESNIFLDNASDPGPNWFIEEPTVEKIRLTDDQKVLLKSSWSIVYSEMGQSLSYVGDNGDDDGNGGSGMAVEDTFIRLFQV